MTISVPESEWRLETNGGIKYRLVERSGTFTEEDATGQEKVIIKAERLGQFVQESLPAPFQQIGTLIYPGPRAMPGTPLACTRISWQSHVDGKPVDPFLQDTAATDGTYEGDLLLTIDYSTSPLNDLTGEDGSDPTDPRTWLDISANASGEFLTTPVRGDALWEVIDFLNSEETAVKETQIPHLITATEVEWTVKWSQIPYTFMNTILMERLRSKLGKVNQAAMPLFFDAPPETILFLGYAMAQQYTWRTGLGGQPPMSLEMKFLEKNFQWVDDNNGEPIQVTHNHYWRPGWGWRRLLVDGTNPTYVSANLTNIFAAQQAEEEE